MDEWIDQAAANFDQRTVTDAPEEAWLGKAADTFQQRQSDQLGATIGDAVKTPPDAYASTRQAAQTIGVPSPLAERQPDQIQALAAQQKVIRQLDGSDTLKKLFQEKPEIAKLAHDDLDNLSLLEQQIIQGYRNIQLGKRAAGAVASGAGPSTAASTIGGLSTVYDFLSEYIGQPAAQAGLIPEDPFARGVEVTQEQRQKYLDMAKQWQGGQPEGVTGQAILSGFESAGQAAPGLILSLMAGGNPLPALLWMGLTQGGQTAGEATAQDVPSPQALLAGVADMTAEIATEVMPLKWLMRDIKVGAPLWKTLMNQFLQEVPQEQVATVWQDFNQWALINQDQTFEDYINARPMAAYQTLVATLVATGVQTGAVHTLSRVAGTFDADQEKARQAEMGKAMLDQFQQLAQQSKLAERAPDAFAETVSAMLGEASDVYIDANEFRQFFQSQNEDPAKVAQDLGIGDQYQSAVVRSGDLKLPASDYLGKLYKYDGINDIVRLQPDGMSAKEAAAWNQAQREQFKTEADKAFAAGTAEESFRASGERVQNQILTELMATQRFPDDVATKYASLHRAFAESMASRYPDLFATPESVYQRFGLKFRSELADQGGQTFSQGPRAKIQFPKNMQQDPTVITLLEGADLTSALHELGHFYYEALRSLSDQADAPEQIKAHIAALNEWHKKTDPNWDGVIGTEQHEQFARGFEAYLFEGKSPSLDLRQLFETFRSWLVRVYRSLKQLNVKLTPEVRQVMDSLLATEEQIRQAQVARNYQPLFESADAGGFSPEDWKAYQDLAAQVTQTADAELAQRSLKNLKWLSGAKSKLLKSLQKDAAAKRKAVRAEVADEVYREPIYAARRFITHGEMNLEVRGQKLKRLATEIGMTSGKLDLGALKSLYGEGPAAPWRYLPVGKYGMTAKDGADPQMVAELFGFSSADELVRKLLEAPPPNQVIEAQTDQRMLERYGDITDPAELERAVNEALHNEARMRLVALELRALDKKTRITAPTGRVNVKGRQISYNVLESAARDYAETAISRTLVKDIKVAPFAAAETRAARATEAALKKGDSTAAAEHKRAQILNMHFFKAASSALSEIERAVRYLKKFDSAGVRKRLSRDYLGQIDQILERYDLRKGVTLKEIEARKSLNAWVADQQAQGNEPQIDEAVLNEARRVSYKDIPLEELRGLRDSVKNIEHLGRLKQKLLTAKDQREFDAVMDDTVDSIRANAKKTRQVDLETELPQDQKARGLAGYFAGHRKLSSFARQLDGLKDNGAVWRLLIRPLNERADWEASQKAAATEALGALFESIRKTRLYAKEHIPEIGMSLSRMGRLMVALNVGNADNRQRLEGGFGWTPAQIEAVLRPLTKSDWDFVQGVWDYIDTFWPEIKAKEERVNGVAPQKVKPMQVATRYGEYRGGYFPIKYNYDLSPKAYADTFKEQAEQMMKGQYSRASTRRGHTKERLREVKRAIRLDFGVVFEHVEQVIHDLAMHEYLIDANRVMGSHRFQTAILETLGSEAYKTMQNTITAVAAGDVSSMQVIDRALNWLRAGTSIAYMGWSVTTSMLQPLGLSQSIVRIGPKWVGRGLARWIGDAVHMENTAAWIYQKSDFMRLRGKTLQREIAEIRNKVAKRGILPDVQDSYFWLITRAQLIADIPTWLGQYEKSLEAGEDDATAVQLANQAVLDSQGGGQIKDLAQVQRGAPAYKIWTNFYSYFNVTWNMAVESAWKANWKSPASIGRLAVDLLMLYSVPSVLSTLMYEALRGQCDGEMDCILARIGRDQLAYTANTLVVARELAGVASGYGYEGPAGTRFFVEATKLAQQAKQGEIDGPFARALAETAGILFHLPAAQAERTVGGLYALGEGEARNPLVIMTGP